MSWKKSSAAVALFVVMTGMMACRDEQVKILAKTTRAVVEACDVLVVDVIKLNDEGKLTDDQEKVLLTAIKKILLADKAANAMVEPLVNLDAKTKLDLLKIVGPILDVIDNTIKTDLITITDSDTRNKITVALQAIKLSVEAALVVLR